MLDVSSSTKPSRGPPWTMPSRELNWVKFLLCRRFTFVAQTLRFCVKIFIKVLMCLHHSKVPLLTFSRQTSYKKMLYKRYKYWVYYIYHRSQKVSHTLFFFQMFCQLNDVFCELIIFRCVVVCVIWIGISGGSFFMAFSVQQPLVFKGQYFCGLKCSF